MNDYNPIGIKISRRDWSNARRLAVIDSEIEIRLAYEKTFEWLGLDAILLPNDQNVAVSVTGEIMPGADYTVFVDISDDNKQLEILGVNSANGLPGCSNPFLFWHYVQELMR